MMKNIRACFFIFCFMAATWPRSTMGRTEVVLADNDVFDSAAEVQAIIDRSHRMHALSILMYCCLLIVAILTMWLFEQLNVKYLHSTGITTIFGLVIGALVAYTSNDPVFTTGQYPNRSSIFHETTVDNGQRVQANVTDPCAAAPTLRHSATFSSELFFDIILPPIIFCAGYNLDRAIFFRNFGIILTFAVLGSIISCLIVGFIMYGFVQLVNLPFALIHCLYFGALISCTDPVTVLNVFTELNVDADLFAIIFGESTLNDAVGLVLAQTIEQYDMNSAGFSAMTFLHSVRDFVCIFLGSLGTGIAVGILNSIFTKFTNIYDYPTLETAVFILMSYCSYLLAEVFGLSGIVTVLFCGICQAHYTFQNLSTEAKQWTQQFTFMVSFLTEHFSFAYITVSLFTSDSHRFDVGFVLVSLLSIGIGRAVFVYSLSSLLNIKRTRKITPNYQHMIAFAGLRGPMAFAIAIRNTSSNERKLIFSATSIIVLVTVVVNGGLLTKAVIRWLKIPQTPMQYVSKDVKELDVI